MRWGAVLASVALVTTGLLVAALLLVWGPKEEILCTEARWPNAVFGDMFGHTDGASYTGCVVPSSLSWMLAGSTATAPVAAVIGWVFFARSHRRMEQARRR